MNNFVHLECFSEYSIDKSIIKINELIQKAKELDYKAIALTDTNNLFAAFKFYSQSLKAKIKPIIGATLTIDNDYNIVALCLNSTGYKNLSYLISKGYENHNANEFYINYQDLITHNQGLIILHGEQSLIAKYLAANNSKQATIELQKFNKTFSKRNYLSIKKMPNKQAEDYIQPAILLAHKTNTPIVATAGVLFLNKEQFTTHEVKICINQHELVDTKKTKQYNEEQYLKTKQEMVELFKELPEAIINSEQIALRCNYKFAIKDKYFLPEFPIPHGVNINDFFADKVNTEFNKIAKKNNLDTEQYKQRLHFEITTIIALNFTGYFLIVADFINWAKNNNISVGVGRGSGAGSLVAYVLGITGVDPLSYDLLFERFLNKARVSMPDFDIDFSPTGRDKVIEYVSNKYGSNRVSQIVTFGTMAAKGVIRDVGRVLGMPYGFCDTIARLIPNDLDITIDKALNYEKHLKQQAIKSKKKFSDIKLSRGQKLLNAKELARRYAQEEQVTSLINLSKELEGLARNIGTHAGGVIIAPTNITDFCPTYRGDDEQDAKICQFDKNDIEAIGLVKFDFLGLSSLDSIKYTTDIVKKRHNKIIDVEQLNLTDDKVYQLYRNGDTTGIFQMESSGMRKYLRALKPTNINDIIAMNALYRPGAMDYIDDYIAVKHGAKISLPHPILKKILTPTNGIFIYQEQVMRTAQKMAGFSLESADLLRRAMGKKQPKEMAKQRQNFVTGALKTNNINAKKANEIFDYIDKFAGYGFNKSHSVAYAIISYQTAYLKAYYYTTFMAVVISGVANNTNKVAEIVQEIKRQNITIIAPNVNLSQYNWIDKDNKTLIYGLGSIKGVGLEFVKQILKNRTTRDYKNLFDFCLRIPKKYLNKKAMEALIYAGAFNSFAQNKKTLIMNYGLAISNAENSQKDSATGQNLLFNTTTEQITYKKYPEYSFDELTALEKSVLGFYFSAHPVDDYQNDLNKFYCLSLSDVTMDTKNFNTIALIEEIFYQETAKGLTADIILSDAKVKLKVKVLSDYLPTIKNDLRKENIVFLSAAVLNNHRNGHKYQNSPLIIVKQLDEIEQLKAKYIKHLTIKLNDSNIKNIYNLQQILLQHPGNNIVNVCYQQKNNVIGYAPLPAKYNIMVNKELISKLNNLLSNNCYKITYK